MFTQLKLECLVDRHCRSSEACMDKKCVDPCKHINCTNYFDGKWCKTKNHQPSCSGKKTEKLLIVRLRKLKISKVFDLKSSYLSKCIPNYFIR